MPEDYDILEPESDYDILEPEGQEYPTSPVNQEFETSEYPRPMTMDDLPPSVRNYQQDAEARRRGFMQPGTEGVTELAAATGMFRTPEEAQREAEENNRIFASGGEEIPEHLKIATALSSGFSKAANLPTKLVGAVMDPMSSHMAYVMTGQKDPAKREPTVTELVLKKINDEEQAMSAADARIHGGGMGYQIIEGGARAIGELPIQMLPAAGARNVAQALKIAAVTGGAIGGASQYTQDRGAGRTSGEALPIALTSGLITGIVTKAFGATGAESILREGLTGSFKQKLAGVLREAGMEASEEMVDSLGQDILDRAANDPSKPLSATIRDLIVSGAVGFGVGGAVSGGRAMLPESIQSQRPDTQDQSSAVVNRALQTFNTERSAEEQFQLEQAEKSGKLSVQDSQRLQELRDRNSGEQQLSPEDREYLRLEREAIDNDVEVVANIPEGSPFSGQVATIDRRSGKILINPKELSLQLQAIPQKRRQAYMKSLLAEESIHLKTDNESASSYWNSLTKAEQLIAKRRYTGSWKGDTMTGVKVSDTGFGHEALRFRLQQMSGMTPTEIAATVGREKWTLQTITAMERAISGVRSTLGTKASKEQRTILDRIQGNLEVAKAAVEGNAEEPAALRISGDASPAINEFTQAVIDPEVKVTNAESQKAGMGMAKVSDLDAMLSLKQNIKSQMDTLKADAKAKMASGDTTGASRSFSQASVLGMKNQAIREAIETAVNLGSWSEERQIQQGKPLGDRPLDWQKNPGVRKWLEQHGEEVGVRISEEPESEAASVRRASTKMLQDFREDINAAGSESEAEKIYYKFRDNLIAELNQTQREWYKESGEELPLGEEYSADNKFVMDLFVLARKELQQRWGDGQQSFPAAIRRGGPSKRGQEVAEQMRRIAEMQAKARGEELPPELATKKAEPEFPTVPPEERVSAEESGALPRITSKDLEAKANEVLTGGIDIPKQERPNFEAFSKWAKSNMEGVRPEQLRDMWEDRVWGSLLKAEPERLESWRKVLGLERNYGARPIAAAFEPEKGFQLQGGNDKVLARQNKLTAESKQRYRNKIIGAIARKLIAESMTDRPALDRSSITVDDVAFSNEKTKHGPYTEINRDDLLDLKRLNDILRDQARASSSDPESASRRLIVVADKKGKVHLLSTYNDAGTQRVTDPAGTMLKNKPTRELNKNFLNQYRPFASLLLADPVKGFRQTFESVSEFNDKIGKEASERSRIGEYDAIPEGPAPEDFEAEGTPGLEGEGGSFMGPGKQLVAGSKGGTMESDAPITPAETQGIVDGILAETGNIESREDVDLAIQGLTDRAQSNRLSAKDRLAISGYRKLFDRIAKDNPDSPESELMARISEAVYSDIVRAPAVKLPEVASSETRRRGSKGVERELTHLRDVAPTTVRGTQGPVMTPEYAGKLRGAPKTAEESAEEKADRLKFIEQRSQTVDYKPLSEMSKEEADKRARREREASGFPQLREMEKRRKIQAARQRLLRKRGILPTYEQAMQIYNENFEMPGAIRRRVGPTISGILNDFASRYDGWMIDRIARHGGPESEQAAEAFRGIVDRAKQFYGQLSPYLDKARDLAGGTKRIPVIGQVPNPEALRAVKWLNHLTPIPGAPFAATARTVDAIERKVKVPLFAQDVIDAARDANFQIGLMFQMAIPGFKASNLFERNVTGIGYDIIREGRGEMWNKWTAALARANKVPLDGKNGVRTFFRAWKATMDAPETDSAKIEAVKQDFSRKFPKVVTHIKHAGRWQAVVHADLFNYLENAAQRAAHARAFRQVWPHSPTGRMDLAEVMKDLRKELAPEYQKDLNALMLTMQGHPTDDYSAMGTFGPTGFGGNALRLFNQTIGNLMSKMALTGQLFVQPGEVIAGSTPMFLGYKNYVKGMASLGQLYSQLEQAGMVNRVIYDFSYDPKSPIRSGFKIAGNTISKAFAEQMFNELQEAGAAATARVVADNITSGNLTNWEKRMLPQTFKAMGFNEDEVMGLMQGDTNLLGQFQRKAAAFLTSGNKAASEGSRLGANRLFSSVFRFQSYPMMKLNQFRKVSTEFWDAWQGDSTYRKRTATEQMARFIGGTATQGALTVALTSLAFGGAQGLKIKLEEAEDEPLKFFRDVFMATLGGPLYVVYRGLQSKGIFGVGENAARLAFPYTIATDLIDFAQGAGRYRDLTTWDKIGVFLKNKTPGTKFISQGLAFLGLSEDDKNLDAAIEGFYRWRRTEEGFEERRSWLKSDVRAEFRTKMKRVVEALKDGNEEKFHERYQEAHEELMKLTKGTSMKEAFNDAKILKSAAGNLLTEEEKESLIERIGEDAFNRLEYFDLMLEKAGDGVLLPKFDE